MPYPDRFSKQRTLLAALAGAALFSGCAPRPGARLIRIESRVIDKAMLAQIASPRPHSPLTEEWEEEARDTVSSRYGVRGPMNNPDPHVMRLEALAEASGGESNGMIHEDARFLGELRSEAPKTRRPSRH